MGPKRVLVAEDEPSSQMLYRETLKKEGYEVLLAGTGREAFEILKKEHVDAIVLDVRMPDMHGLELLDTLRKEGIHLPTILCTALAKAADSFEARTYGVHALLLKPVDLNELRAKVREAIESGGEKPSSPSQEPKR